MNKFSLKRSALALLALITSISAYSQQACSEWSLYLSNVIGNTSIVYKVDLNAEGSTAELTALKTLDYSLHIAFNEADGLLYLINTGNGAVQTLDPSVVDGSLGSVVALEEAIPGAVTAAFNAQGELFIGSDNLNKIFQVNPIDGSFSFYADAPVSGGDIAFDAAQNLYLATRTGGKLMLVIPGFDNMLLGSVPNLVTGMALLEDGNLIVSANGNSSFITRNTDGDEAGLNYVLSLNNTPFILANGDMASGCSAFTPPPSVDSCENFKTYYTGYPANGQPNELYEVTVADGTATFSLVNGFSTGDNHIALDAEGIIYAVRGAQIDIFDPSIAAYSAQNIAIKTAGGQSISGFPTAVIDSEGTLWLARATNNTVYSVEFVDGHAIATPQFVGTPVAGGDLVVTIDSEGNDVLWVANRSTNVLYNLNDGTSVPMPLTQVNGVSVLGNGKLLLANGATNADGGLYEWDPFGGTLVQLSNDGGPAVFFNGDLAGRCLSGDDDETEEPEPVELCYGFETLNFFQGPKTNGQPVASDRSNPLLALGAPQLDNSAGSFFSLGVGGFIEIGFEGVVFDLPGNDILVVETSFSGNNCGFGDDEFADIELSLDGINWVFHSTICRNEEIDIAVTGLPYVAAIRISNSADTNTPDGYDVDGVVALQGCGDAPEVVIEPGDCVASEVLEYNPVGNIAADRTNAENALGTPERDNTINFATLGFGGSLIIGFDGAAAALPGVDDLEVVETTFGNQNCQSFEERADVYVSQQVVADASEIDHSLFVLVGQSCTNGAFFDVHAATGFDYFTLVKIVDVTPEAAQLTNRDGYDVDGIVALNNACFGDDEPGDQAPAPATAQNQTITLTAYPNPSTGPVGINFNSGKEQAITVEVLDLSGRVVATLYRQVANAGQDYRLDFDGSALPNGLYITKLSSEEGVKIHKILIAR
jgi:hypothetical protein